MTASTWLRAALLSFLTSCAASAQEPPPAGDALPARLRATVAGWNDGRFRGAVLVARGAEVLLADGFGPADPDAPDGARMTARTLFDSGSVSKQFTAAAALRLHVAGVLRLDDPISRHLPGVPADKAKLTLRHLLDHSSGIARWVNFSSAAFERRDALVADILAAPLERPIGAEFDYSNLNYFLAAALIERASGRPFERVLEEDVFAPAGLADTGFVEDEDLRDRPLSARVFHVEDERGGPTGEVVNTTVLDYSNMWGNKGATGVVTTVLDLHRWDRALAGDALFDAAAKAELFRSGPGGYALGWFVDETLTGARRVQHSGSTRGYTAQLTRLVDDDVVIAVLADEDGDAPGLANRLELALLAARAATSPETLRACEGTWELRAGDVVRGRFVVAVDGAQLVLRARGAEAACRVLYGVSHLPDWPGMFERVCAEAEAALGELSAGAGPDTALRRAWQAITGGEKPARVEVVGSHTGEDLVTYAEVARTDGPPVLVRLTWAGRGRIGALEPAEGPSPFVTVMIPTGPRAFAGRSLAGARLRLELDADGDRLTWFDETAGEEDAGVVLTRGR
jgi:CubicO group peptidase (beta-lactamase class C family)